ncbi:Ger(x)C family spore germination protein [Viridibacillus sp. NPDC096237]|uniref:Ger(x)C family spore germination protein n=1 Tax=Viridibacillus sp. NPDC096237 TaxID=3390721 RepID=UPI003CFC2EB7
MNKGLLIIVIILSTLLTGCWDVNDPEQVLYIHGIGVDFKDGQYEVYAQVIDFSNTAKNELTVNKPTQSEVGYATGKTVSEAVFKLYHSMDAKVFWGFVSYIIFSEEALKNERANHIIDTFIRYRETRYQIWVYGTTGSVKDILLTTPNLNKSLVLSELGNPENSYEQESFIKPINFRTLIIGLNEPNHEISIPFVSIKKWETEQEVKNEAVLSGVGVLSPHEFKGFISAEQVRGLQWMSEDTKRGEVTATVGSNKEQHLTVVIDKVKVKVKPIVSKDKVKFDIDIKLNANIGEFQKKVPIDEVRKEVIKEVKKEINDTYKEALENDADIYRLSEYLYRKNVRAWKKFQKNGKVELNKDSMKLSVKINKFKTQRKSFKDTIDK